MRSQRPGKADNIFGDFGTFQGTELRDCCVNSTLILDPEYFACHRLGPFGNQTWLGDKAGVSVVFRFVLQLGLVLQTSEAK